jgi:hypothetical protein
MRLSLASVSFFAVGLAAAFGGLGVGCTSLLGDFSSGGGADGGVTGEDGPVSTDGATDSATVMDSGATDGGAVDARADSASADSGADVDAAPWSPTTLDAAGKLALWLEASSSNVVVSSGLVGMWNDLSSNANDATNTTGGPQVETAAVNGHDAVHFNARDVTLSITDAASLQFGTDQFAIAAVARASTGGGYFFSKALYGRTGGGSDYSAGFELLVENQANDAGNQLVYPVAHVDSSSGNEIDWSGNGFEDGNYHVLVMRRPNSFELALTLDSQTTQTAPTGAFNVSQTGQAVVIGGIAYGSFNSPVDLSIAEMLVIHSSTGVVADADVASVQAYLKQKYGL